MFHFANDSCQQNLYKVNLNRNIQIVLYDSANGDEPRFSNVGAIMTSECVVEYAAVWPDIPPIPCIILIPINKLLNNTISDIMRNYILI